MTRISAPDSSGNVPGALAATPEETRAVLLTRSKRSAAPIAKPFVQNPDRSSKDRRGPLADFVNNGDLRGLQAFCFLHGIVSSGEGPGGWSAALPLRTWARAFGITETATPQSASSAASKLLTRLAERKLITRERRGRNRLVEVTLLRPDGSGAEYTRPVGQGVHDRFINLPHLYWTEGWYRRLDLPALAMLLVCLHEKPGFELVTARVPEWYGWSADTAERGFKALAATGVLQIDKRTRKEPLAPDGITTVNVYTLLPPLDRRVSQAFADVLRSTTASSAGGSAVAPVAAPAETRTDKRTVARRLVRTSSSTSRSAAGS